MFNESELRFIKLLHNKFQTALTKIIQFQQ